MDDNELREIESRSQKNHWSCNTAHHEEYLEFYAADVPRLVAEVRRLTAAVAELGVERARLAAERDAAQDAEAAAANLIDELISEWYGPQPYAWPEMIRPKLAERVTAFQRQHSPDHDRWRDED